ncbi:hypothetical protein JTE90_021286 [Oedothorax gibbosus]|uniref:Gag-like protein n=1 Tax=Oedothorax gibbosus TaxID=931172 RepID=A0AAV6TTH2_9ARAC|nr:hypothetical protein JTE90_021286 [Oedothorax gibbosus]
MSSEMGEIKEAIKNSLDNLKIDLTNHSMPSTSASPTYADIIGRENNNTTTMFVDLPTDGEGGKDFKGFKNKLESLLTNENVKCNGIFETKKGVKISAPSLTDAHKIRDYLSKTETFSNLKVNVITKELPKFIVKFTNVGEEEKFMEQLTLKNPILKDISLKPLFKITLNDQYHWILEVPSNAYRIFSNLGFVFLGLSKHKIMEFLSIKHCKKCALYGHTTKRCPYAEDRCLKCGELAHQGTCVLSCFTCKTKNKSNYGFNEICKTNHRIASINCPEYRKQERLARSRIDHGN